ncbi:TPA: hypothetical protein MH648_25230 [Klebsiella pneumoniae]|nr:hypothetical protein [Klebsiella pneumoniae]
MVCVVGRIRDLILQLSKSSIYSTKPLSETKWRGPECLNAICITDRLYNEGKGEYSVRFVSSLLV